MNRFAWDLFMTVYNNTDRVAHQHLDQKTLDAIESGDGIDDEDMLIKTYRNADFHLGELMACMGGDASVIVMSDHGSGPIRRVFYLNGWLEKAGLLEYRKKRRQPLNKILSQARFLAKRFLPRGAKNFIETQFGGIRDKVESRLSFSHIDWEKTKAYGFGMYGNVFINLKGREPNGIVEPGREYDSVCDEIVDKLGALTDPDTGESIVTRVYRRQELYEGPYVEDAPDLLIGWKDYSYYTSVAPMQEADEIFGSHVHIDCSEYKHVGTHRLGGTFIAMGQGIKKGGVITGAGICDVAPTILYMLDIPIPNDMDGQLLGRIFEEGFFRDHPPKYERAGPAAEPGEFVSYSDEESREVAERLKGLGYL